MSRASDLEVLCACTDSCAIREAARAAIASIRTRTGQIDQANSRATAYSFGRIDQALGALRLAADDLERALTHAQREESKP